MANTLALAVLVLVLMTAAGQQSNVIVEMGEATTLQCNIPAGTSPTTVTWRLDGSSVVDLFTCTILSGVCNVVQPSQYKASVSANKNALNLNVTSARINETVFTCSADNNPPFRNITLEVYAWPTKPTCSQSLKLIGGGASSYIEYTCTTTNVYPNGSAVLHRNGTLDFTAGDFDPQIPECVRGASGTAGGFMFSCIWRTPISKFINGLGVYVEMSAVVSNLTLVNKLPSVSDERKTTLSVPEVRVTRCPVGPGVIGGRIRIGTQANCTCQLTSSGLPSGTAQWRRTLDGNSIGIPTTGGSSILMLSYNASDPSPTYLCVPNPPFASSFVYYNYTVLFSSAPPSGITGLHVVVIALAALSSLITSHVH